MQFPIIPRSGASSNSGLAKMDAPSCWAPAIDCRQHGSELNGPGDWRVEKHGTTKRRAWHKLHIGLDAVSGEIVASTLTGRDIDDGSHVATLLDQVDGSVGVFLGDGAYDSAYLYAAVEERHPDGRTLVASIGPVCSAALRKLGVRVDIEAQPPKLGPLIDAINAALSDPRRLGKS